MAELFSDSSFSYFLSDTLGPEWKLPLNKSSEDRSLSKVQLKENSEPFSHLHTQRSLAWLALFLIRIEGSPLGRDVSNEDIAFKESLLMILTEAHKKALYGYLKPE